MNNEPAILAGLILFSMFAAAVFMACVNIMAR